MNVTIHYLAQIKRAVGVGSETLEVAGATTLRELIAHLGARHPAALRADSVLLFFVNDDQADRDQILHDGDQIAILAPMSGG